MHQFGWIMLFSAWEKRSASDTFIFLWKVTILSKHSLSISFWPLLSFLQAFFSVTLKHSHVSTLKLHQTITPLPHPVFECAFLYWTQIQRHIHRGTNLSIITSCLTTATVIRSFHLAKNHMVLLFDKPWGTRVRLTVCCHLSVAQNGMQPSAQMRRV